MMAVETTWQRALSRAPLDNLLHIGAHTMQQGAHDVVAVVVGVSTGIGAERFKRVSVKKGCGKRAH